MLGTIVGFGYLSRRGKDTVARFIWEAFGCRYNVVRFSFARTLKREVNGLATAMPDGMRGLCKLLGCEYDPKPDMSDPECPLGKQRALLQTYGALRRTSNPEYLLGQLREFMGRGGRSAFVLVTDLRFKKEAEFVKLFGYTVKVSRPNFYTPDSDNSLETDLHDWPFDFEISAPSGDLKSLRKQAIGVFERVIAKEVEQCTGPKGHN